MLRVFLANRNIWATSITDSKFLFEDSIGNLKRYAYEFKIEEHIANENFRHKKLQSLPKGTVIQFCFPNGDKVEATKCSPAYQFKKTWWSTSDGRYVKKKDIPGDFLVVSK